MSPEKERGKEQARVKRPPPSASLGTSSGGRYKSEFERGNNAAYKSVFFGDQHGSPVFVFSGLGHFLSDSFGD
jgi:hypothetical protein